MCLMVSHSIQIAHICAYINQELLKENQSCNALISATINGHAATARTTMTTFWVQQLEGLAACRVSEGWGEPDVAFQLALTSPVFLANISV